MRQILAAVNEIAAFEEAIEQLMLLAEQHGSYGNRLTLLEHQAQVAPPEQAVWACLASGWLYLSYYRDPHRAQEAIERGLATGFVNAATAMALEVVAARLENRDLLIRALELRVEASTNERYRGALRMDLSRELAEGSPVRAAEILTELMDSGPGPLALQAARRLELLAQRTGRSEWLRSSLDRQVELHAAELHTGELHTGDTPATARAQLLLRSTVARCVAAHGSPSGGPLPSYDDGSAAAVVRAQRLLAWQLGSLPLVGKLANRELQLGADGPAAASAHLALSERLMSEGQEGAALQALVAATAADPTCSLAHARLLDRLLARQDWEEYAVALERWAESCGPTRGAWLLAAATWGRTQRDADRTEAAVARAISLGYDAVAAKRLVRAIAHEVADLAWFTRSTQALRALLLESSRLGAIQEVPVIANGAGKEPPRATAADAHDEAPRRNGGPSNGAEPNGSGAPQSARFEGPRPEAAAREAAELTAELLHLSIAIDSGDAAEHIAALAVLPGGAYLASLATAATLRSESGAEPFAHLAQHCSEPGLALEARWVSAVAQARGGDLAGAESELKRLREQHPEAALPAGTWLALLRKRNEVGELCQSLDDIAAACPDPEVAGRLHVESALRKYWSGQRPAAVESLDRARVAGHEKAALLRRWAVRTLPSDPDLSQMPSGRAERVLLALDAAVTTREDSPRLVSELCAALDDTRNEPCPDLERSAELFLAIRHLSRPASGAESLARRLWNTPGDGPLGTALRLLDTLRQRSVEGDSLREAAEAWARQSGSLAGHLEWIAGARRSRDEEAEPAAMDELAQLSSPELRPWLRSSAALFRHVRGQSDLALLDGSDEATRLTNLEIAPPGCPPRRRAAALEGAEHVLDAESAALADLLRGYNLLEGGAVEDAYSCFTTYRQAFPEDPAGWEACVECLNSGHEADPKEVLALVEGLQSSMVEPRMAAELLEKASDLFADRLGDEERAHALIKRATELDPRRDSSLQRLLGYLPEGSDEEQRLKIIDRRLHLAKEDGDLVPLLWARARSLRRLDRLEDAATAAQQVLQEQSEHVEALAMVGEVYVSLGRHEEAVEILQRAASLESAPREQRLAGGLAAVDILENQLDSTERALEVLLAMHKAGLSDPSIRERIARAAAKSGAWKEAVAVLEKLMFERKSDEERAEAARMALAIYRDKLEEPHSAGQVVQVLLGLLPTDAETIDVVASGVLDPQLTADLAERSKNALLNELHRAPHQTTGLVQLTKLSRLTRDLGTYQAAIGALVALGEGGSAHLAELAMLEEQSPRSPNGRLEPRDLERLLPERYSALDSLLHKLSPTLAPALGPTLATLGIRPKDSIRSAGFPLYDQVQAWATSFGFDDVDLYRIPAQADVVGVVAGSKLSVVVGYRVTAPLGPAQRQALARCLFGCWQGGALLGQRPPTFALSLLSSLARIGGVPDAASGSDSNEELDKTLKRVLPRKLRKSLPELLADLPPAQEQRHWLEATEAALDRVSALASGDASHVLGEFGALERGATGPVAHQRGRAGDLLAFVLSPLYVTLRNRLGVAPS